ncbi:hypothetical protein CCZ37_14895 [Vibrio qinghaiensis]|jgi:hypothetical protein|uniref:Flavodoxin n=1 Tax=Vibrio qinghaiensis TaxID=2025808 RepID=A0A223N271_9VIBR|nr:MULTISPECIES: hypothetical protein [Vibrio]ASU23868.1 hypothetical protein CCZ37_14895 [Vibrio qinghaiensis]
MINQPDVVAIKNQWLFDQVNVEFPTQESLQGRDLYQQAVIQRSYRSFMTSIDDPNLSLLDEIYLVDFHRMTIWFALLQASLWDDKNDQSKVIEFFTQIIYSPPCELYLGFKQGEPVAAGVVTFTSQALLISDIVVLDKDSFGGKDAFIHLLLEKLRSNHEFSGDIFIEQ